MAYYYDNEMLKLPEKAEWTPPAIGCGPGKWYRGRVVAEHITPQNVLMYKCTFDTPLQHTHLYTAIYAQKTMKSFLELQAMQGWASSSQQPCHNEDDMAIGDAVIKWFAKANLPKDHSISETMRGAFVEGIIIDVDKKKNGTKYKLSFDVLTMGENWYSEEDTRLYHERSLKSKVKSTTEGSSAPLQGQPLCLGKRQRAAVGEACAIVTRPTKGPRCLVPGTQDEHISLVQGKDAVIVSTDVFMALLNSMTVDDMDSNAGSDASEQNNEDDNNQTISDGDASTSTGNDEPVEREEDTPVGPGALYTAIDKNMRKQTYPCPVCGDPADGAHQCGLCYRHVHVICAPGFPGSEEGYGQVLQCPKCLPKGTDTASLDEGQKSPLYRSKLGMGEIQRRRNAKLERERAALERQESLKRNAKTGLKRNASSMNDNRQ